MKPDLKWLVLKDDNVPANAVKYSVGPKSYPYAFRPLAIGYVATERLTGILYVDEEPYANTAGDLAAQFGQARASPSPLPGEPAAGNSRPFMADAAIHWLLSRLTGWSGFSLPCLASCRI